MTRFMPAVGLICVSLGLPAWNSHTRADTVPITVEEPSGVDRTGWPVTSGIPLAPGALIDANHSALFFGDDKEIPLQTEVLARWPDGSIRWLLLDFQVDLVAGQKRSFTLRYGDGVERGTIERPVAVRKADDSVFIETWPLRLQIASAGNSPLGNVWLDSDEDGTFSPAERITGSGPKVSDIPAEILVEQSGPMRACVRLSGRCAAGSGKTFRYVVRLHAYRGRPFVRLDHTFVADHHDSVMTKIDELDLTFPLRTPGSPVRHCVIDGKSRPPEPFRVMQIDESRYEINAEPAGRRAAGWAVVGTDTAGLAVGLRHFWQNWPKSISVSPETRPDQPGTIEIGVCPRLREGLYDGKPLEQESKLYYHLQDGGHTLKVGVAKTHELWATFFAGKPDVDELAEFFQAAEEPLLATCDPTYVSSTKAAGDFPPADPGKPGRPDKYFGYDAWLDRALDAHLQRRDEVREYGMLNFGDWYGERGVNWGNLEYDLAHGLFLQYLRTGDRKFFARAEEAARHHIDVDVVHAVNPHLKNPWGDPPRVGDIWLHCVGHTGGYYENAPLPVSRTYQLGHSTNFGHVWVNGDLDYYYLTGDRRALDVSRQIADAMVSHMPNRYGTHIRALGWPMILVLAAYEATGDPKYIQAATKNWQVLKENIDWRRGWVVRLAGDHCLHPEGSTREERQEKYRDQRCEGNVPFMEGLTLCALARYHRATGDPEVLRAISVGIDQMIRECWQEDVKTFRYTACTLSSKSPYALLMLSVEAMAYEAALTGNEEHRRVLCEGFRASVPESGQEYGKGLAQMIFFAPHALSALED